MTKYHWASNFTGEIVETFPQVIKTTIHDLWVFRKRWDFTWKVKYIFKWEYSKLWF